MKAAILYKPREKIEIRDVEVPKPKSLEVLVKVTSAGLCHTDVHIWEGHYGPIRIEERGVKFPLIMGHEIAGIVEEIGTEVSKFKKGDKVLVYPWIGDGTCSVCISGDENLCPSLRPLGILQPGGFAEYTLVPNFKYLVPADDLDLDYLAPLVCSGITAYNAVKKANLKPDERLLIIGAGGLGLMAVQLAKALFKPEVIVADIRESSLEEAERLGADYTINATKANLVEEVKRFTNGQGVHTVIDFVNTSDTSLMGFSCLRRGGKMILVGLHGEYSKFVLPLIPLRAISIIGVYTGNLKDLAEVVSLQKKGIIKTIIQRRRLLEINEAIRDLREGKVTGRIVLKPEL